MTVRCVKSGKILNLTFARQPDGEFIAFAPASIRRRSTALELRRSRSPTSGSTPAGTNTVTINGISGGQTHSTNVTFIVTVANTPPVLSPISNRVVNAGVTLAITNVATDSDTPAQTLTFNLLTAPTSAVLNANSGIFTWRSAVAQANTTKLTTLKVTDSGTPPLSATQSFSIVVNPLARPVLGLARLTNGFWKLNVTGPAGPDYSIQGASNLVNWTALTVSNSATLPFTWIDGNNVPAWFYRVLLGP